MRKLIHSYTFLGIIVAFMLLGCKSDYEKVRTSGDPALILKKAQEYYDEEEYQRAQTLYELIISTYRGKKEAEDISFKYAYTYYYLRNYLLSNYYFNNFVQTYSTSPKRREAQFMAAYSNYRLSPKFRLDQTYTNKAIEDFQLFINTFPNSERVEQCNQLIDEMRLKLEMKAFDEGMLYFNRQLYTASVQVFENLLKDFPETKNTHEVRYMIVESAYLLAENSVLQRQEERYSEVLELANDYIDRFQDSDFLKKVENRLSDAQKKVAALRKAASSSDQ